MSGIYIHIPFCKQACHYCDFHFSTNLKKKGQMLNALVKELELRKTAFKDDVVKTIYFGGGTPSILNTSEIEKLIASVYQNYTIDKNPEITLEANPDDLTEAKIEDLAKSPVNRLSIGVQSFFEEDLKLMNRAHNALEGEKCIGNAKKHFDNISIDLIYGIPGMSNERWKSNIEKALSFEVPHISSYALTVEPKTALKKFIEKGLVQNVDDRVAQGHFKILNRILEANGYQCYEISNFSKPGYYSKNNSAYWQQKKYLGIGPSAHSFDGDQRGWNINNNSKYIKALQADELPIEIEELSQTDKYNEYVMTGLRTIWGVSLERIVSEYGEKYKEYLLMQADKHLINHLLYIDDNTLLTTEKGKFLADGIASDLFMLNLK